VSSDFRLLQQNRHLTDVEPARPATSANVDEADALQLVAMSVDDPEPDMAMGCISVTLKKFAALPACQTCRFETALQPFF
jgi:hypothetical protein